MRFKVLITCALLIAFFPLYAVLGAMTSPSYKIPSDSINFGGGSSGSASYNSESTFGEVGTGDSTSASYKMRAGFQQMQEGYIAISTASNVTMSTIGGISAGTSNGSTVWTVTTDNAAGYSFSVKASTAPALKGTAGASFYDYATTTDPTYDFTVPSGQSLFGFSPEGSDVTQEFKDDGSNTCNTGASMTADKCWAGLYTSSATIAQSTSSNHPLGTDTTIKFKAGIGTSKVQDADTYTATITVTAVTL